MQRVILISIFVLNVLLFFYFLIFQQYFPVLVCLNILGVICLVELVFDLNKFSLFLINHKRELGIVMGLLIVATVLYLIRVDQITPGIQSDELTIAQTSEQILRSSSFVPFVNVNYGHPTPLLYATGISIKLFGRNITAIRLPYILFGALSIAAFYVLLRLYFKKFTAASASLLLMFSYPFIVVSRLAFEITPEIFFQIITVICFVLAWRKRDIKLFAATGIALGFGFYTYLGFRTFGVIIILLLCYLVVRQVKKRELVKRYLGIFLLGLFVVVMPLLSYSIGHISEIQARAYSLSPFTQKLPSSEIAKELVGNVVRLSNLFLPTGGIWNQINGDPNLKNNPTKVQMFDYFTVILLITGIIFLIKKDKRLLILIGILCLSPLVNDLFTIERVSIGHYYGIGHPNTLRIAGIIPIIYFIIAFGIENSKPFLDKLGYRAYGTVITIFIFVIVIYNYNLYYNQPFNDYDYTYNGAVTVNLANLINNSHVSEVAASPQLLQDPRFEYFLNPGIKVENFAPKNSVDAIKDIANNKLTIFMPNYNKQMAYQLYSYAQSQPNGIETQTVMDPLNLIEALVFMKTY